MKKLLLSLLMLCSATLFAQNYIIKVNNGSATMLAPVEIFNIGWDDTSTTLPLGFEMKYNNMYIDSVTINSNGYVTLENAGMLYLFGIDFLDRTLLGVTADHSRVEFEQDSIMDTQNIHYGSKVVRINWNGPRFKGSGDTNYVNTTMILYSDNTIEYYYGASKVHQTLYYPSQLGTYPKCAVCLQTAPGIYDCLVARGNVSSPTWEIQGGVSTPNTPSPPWGPVGQFSGDRYAFEPDNLGFNELEANAVMVYPNPATDQVRLKTDLSGKSYSILICDIMGRIVYSGNSTDTEHSIDISTLAKGFYSITVTSDNAHLTKKLIIE